MAQLGSASIPRRGPQQYSDILVSVFLVTIVLMLIVQMPPFLLAVLQTINITLSVVILLVTVYVTEALQFSVFPSLLLMTTLLRLALNVSAMRLILLHGDAGDVIRAFGDLVMGGNAMVGFIVFLILVIIQFVVITKGAERVSEVAARFTLDAMPGKQMAIDADLNAGLINEADARERRRKIQREADFYGAMDGASKFIKGDAIAGIIIIVINIIAGIILGVAFGQLDIMTAISKYTILTVGDGLVAQIPALLISTAMGVMVTRAASDDNLGNDLFRQLMQQPKVLGITAALLFLFGVIGFPIASFWPLAAILGYLAWAQARSAKRLQGVGSEVMPEQESEEVRKPESVTALLQVDPIELDLGYSLLPLADPKQGGDLLDRLVMIRRQTALDLGLIVPTIRIRDNLQLRPSVYSLKLKGIEVAQGELRVDQFLAMNPGDVSEAIQGTETVEPAFGLPALWIAEHLKERAEMAGYTVVDPPSVLATHITEVLRSNAHEILGRQEVQTLLDTVKADYPSVVEELIPNVMTVGDTQRILANLLRERVSIRNMVTILETLADYGRATRDPDMLTEYVRAALARQISRQNAPDDNVLRVITLDPEIEQTIHSAIQRGDNGSYLALDPTTANRILERLESEIQRVMQMGYQPVLLCAPLVRLYVKRLSERNIPGLVILSYNELDSKVEVQALGMVRM